ncbi:DUF5694 domain-containing protein [Halobacillus sp. A1]|uniref:DUF5694 domain-containing protein n=1 Tax=Halobacillus sp. A1 TaxID=2880262 RepID=UPI0020A67CE0|nr:DUF5694 domain-containing protein [Halobacillus sp. A1]MCP3030206.1 DUF5694 domain-containing protein [Halobacillus sp. A1]
MQKPSILLIGTVHLAMDPDIVNHQKDQIKKVVDALQTYEPTKIAVEKPFLIEEELDRKYNEFKDGKLLPSYDEVEQIAFPLAAHFEHQNIYPVDEVVDMSNPSLNQVFQWAKEHQPELFQEIAGVQTQLKRIEDHSTFIKSLQTINDNSYIEEMQRVYMKLTRVGDRQHQVGVKWLKQWHERDLAIAANISRMAGPGDRIIVLVGGDHLHLLRRFLNDSGDFNIESQLEYLPK